MSRSDSAAVSQPPGTDIPRVTGHFNFWPVAYDPGQARNGAPDDERLQPGDLFDRMRRRMPSHGLIQLNHPFGDSSLERDTGYLTAVDWDPRTPIPDHDDGTNAGQLAIKSPAGTRNIDHDVQEVMNGHSLTQYLRNRQAWFGFLDLGELRAGTANSDTHAMTVGSPGFPRNIVFGNPVASDFHESTFLDNVKNGRMVGTNGPVIIACIEEDDGTCHGPGLQPLPAQGLESLRVTVSAAPWIDVEEVRVVGNGEVVWSLGEHDLVHPANPLGLDETMRWAGSIALSELLSRFPGEQDVWLVVEAGDPLPPFRDANGDGLPDDVDEGVPATTPCPGCGEPDRECRFEADWLLNVVAPGTHPTAFTNPFLISRSGVGRLGLRQRP